MGMKYTRGPDSVEPKAASPLRPWSVGFQVAGGCPRLPAMCNVGDEPGF